MAALLLLLAAPPLAAQRQLFVGYSLLDAEPDRAVETVLMNGAHAQLVLVERDDWGLVLDVSGHVGTGDTRVDDLGVREVDLAYFTALVGLGRKGFRFGRLWSQFGGFAGVSRGVVDGELNRVLRIETTAFTAAFGGSLILDLTDRYALRLIQPNVIYTTFAGGSQWSQRYSAGLVLRLGEGG
jgi:hypothetical protein